MVEHLSARLISDDSIAFLSFSLNAKLQCVYISLINGCLCVIAYESRFFTDVFLTSVASMSFEYSSLCLGRFANAAAKVSCLFLLEVCLSLFNHFSSSTGLSVVNKKCACIWDFL